MFLPEFLEALCRAVDKASPIPPGDSKDEWPLEKRQAQPLVKKLENILPTLIKLITHPDLKLLREKFPMPPKDLVTGLYTPNYESPFYKDYIIKPRQNVRRNTKIKREKIVAVDKDNEDKNKNEEEENDEGKGEKDNNENNENNNENEEVKENKIENDEEKDKNEGDENNDENNNENINNENKDDDKEQDNKEDNKEDKNLKEEGITKEETAETHPN